MKTRDGFVQAYNAQLAVDGEHQVIVAQMVVAEQNDTPHLPAMVAQMRANTGRTAKELSADNGYFSAENLRTVKRRRLRAYISPGRSAHGDRERSRRGKAYVYTHRLAREMAARVRRGGFRSRYRLRKQIVEPVNGQIKEARGFRRFSLRGLSKVRGEWSLVCAAHNLLKLARHRP
jgi:hypothetical protein